MKKEILILVGNIGSGKTTMCKELAKEGYVIISKDDIRYSIGAGAYTFNLDYEEKISNVIFEMVWDFMLIDVPIVIDETNMDRKTRLEYLNLADDNGYKKVAIVFPINSMKKSVERRLKNNHGNTPKEVWEEVWTRKNEAYEEPTEAEGFDEVIQSRKLEKNKEK